MGLLFNSAQEISDKVYERFGDRENFLLVMKHNDFKKGLLKLIVSKLYYAMDSSRTFVLYFSPKGIQEVEVSNTLKKDFLLMPWNEISNFEVKTGLAKIGYKIPFEGRLFADNKGNFLRLEDKDWNRI